MPRAPCLGVTCRPGWGEYSASRLMSWTPTWAKVILQLTAPCWQNARLEACFPPPPTRLIPPRQKHNTAMQTICLPLAKGGDSSPHWAPLAPSVGKSSSKWCRLILPPGSVLHVQEAADCSGRCTFIHWALGLPLCPGPAAARVDGTSLLAPPAERQFPHWRLTPRGHVSLKMAFCSAKLPNPFGYREYALLGAFFFFFFVQASPSGENYASAGWMGGREKAQGPRTTLPRSLTTLGQPLFHPSESFQTG